MTEIAKGVYFSSDYTQMNFDLIYDVIKNSYWGKSRTKQQQLLAMNSSINFGLFINKKQVAYTRVLTDYSFFAYLMDVFVVKNEQGKGYSKLLLQAVFQFPKLNNIDKWMLATKDAHSLYNKFGFNTIESPEKLMEKLNTKAKKHI
ncbi:GNAT family N-acetyltransferase [Cognatitamlana onchidii]|uniref:GNAT family N-acetyltransferase n=1 Tax=Cognatitamlana onchidii TaxID=2562860 RepID=UPI0010A64EE9|nr:GNAT family N-acetyltransferase [Algibacter onchidii]